VRTAQKCSPKSTTRWEGERKAAPFTEGLANEKKKKGLTTEIRGRIAFKRGPCETKIETVAG